jgi:hypothetical protein
MATGALWLLGQYGYWGSMATGQYGYWGSKATGANFSKLKKSLNILGHLPHRNYL